MLTSSSTLARPEGLPVTTRTSSRGARAVAVVARASRSNDAAAAAPRASVASFAAAAVLSLLAAAGPASADLNRLEAAAGGGEREGEKKKGLGGPGALSKFSPFSIHVRAVSPSLSYCLPSEFNVGTALQFGEATIDKKSFKGQDLRRSNFTAASCRSCNFAQTKLNGEKRERRREKREETRGGRGGG